MIEELRNSAAHVVVNNLANIELDEHDSHHVFRVLRVRDGNVVTATDGQGNWRSCRVVGRDALEPTGEVIHEAAPAYRVGVAFVPVKAEKPETTVKQLVEVGVDDIVVLLPTVRAVAGARDRLHERVERLVREACMQSRRVYAPQVTIGIALTDISSSSGVVFADPQGGTLTGAHRMIVVGPEGGFEESEIPTGTARVGIGPVVMRAETASLVAGARLVSLREGQ